jgi:hypothetical protein
MDLTGIAPNTVVMTTDAWALLKTDPGLTSCGHEAAANWPRRKSKAARLSSRALARVTLAAWVTSLYTYSGTYTDPEDGAVKHILPPTRCSWALRALRVSATSAPSATSRPGFRPASISLSHGKLRTLRPLPSHAERAVACALPAQRGPLGNGGLMRVRGRGLPPHRDGGLKPSASLH